MSKDKHRLHDRAMRLYKRVIARPVWGLPYCRESGVGPSPELDYLIRTKRVKIVRPRTSSSFFGGHIRYSSIHLT